MVRYNPLHQALGIGSQFAGLGIAIYGLITRDIETIAGGVAISYVGRNIVTNFIDFGKNKIQEQRNAILKSESTLEDKIK